MAVSYGGQAVLEGVMMRSPSSWAVAIRTPDGDIAEVVNEITSPMQRGRLWRLPVIRGVIALRDPGVPNWLDTTGHTEGTLAVRFLLAEGAAKPELQVVPLAEVRAHLPAGTREVSPTERGETLRRRRRAVWRRFRR